MREVGTRQQQIAAAVLGLAALVLLAAFDELLFRVLFDRDHWRWYLENGALIAIVFGFVSAIWGDLNKLTGLVSAHPLEFLASCVQLNVLPGVAIHAGQQFDWLMARRVRKMNESMAELHRVEAELARSSPGLAGLAERSGASVARARTRRAEEGPRTLGRVDLWLALLIGWAFFAAWALWLVVVAPLQYAVTIVAGAPARTAIASPRRSYALVAPTTIEVGEAPKSGELPEDATESGLSARPVAVTSVVSAGVLFVASRFVG